MAQQDPVLFSVLIDRSGGELKPRFIGEVAERTKACVGSLLQVAGYEPRLSVTTDKFGKDWLVVLRVDPKFLVQLDLFETKGPRPSVQQVSTMVIEAAVVAIRRFRRETGGVIAARLSETLEQLRSADPRVIAALAKQPGRRLTIRSDVGDLELSVQSESNRTMSAEPQPLMGFIRTIGFVEMTVMQFNKKSPQHLCMHPCRVRIPAGLRSLIDPVKVLSEFVEPQVRMQLLAQAEQVVRKRQHVTFLLAHWPPTLLAPPLERATSVKGAD